MEDVLPGQRKPLPEVLLGRGAGQNRANEKGREKGLEKGPCQQCCPAVSHVPKKPTRAGHGGHNLGSVKRAVQWVGALRFYRGGGASRKGAA